MSPTIVNRVAQRHMASNTLQQAFTGDPDDFRDFVSDVETEFQHQISVACLTILKNMDDFIPIKYGRRQGFQDTFESKFYRGQNQIFNHVKVNYPDWVKLAKPVTGLNIQQVWKAAITKAGGSVDNRIVYPPDLEEKAQQAFECPMYLSSEAQEEVEQTLYQSALNGIDTESEAYERDGHTEEDTEYSESYDVDVRFHYECIKAASKLDISPKGDVALVVTVKVILSEVRSPFDSRYKR